MRTIFTNLNLKKKHEIDFSLIPIGIILLELSVFATELNKAKYRDLISLVSMRLLHTIVLLVVTLALSKTLLKLHKTNLSYSTIASLGLIVIGFGIYAHDVLAVFFEVEAFSLIRQFGSGLIQGLFWFPAFILVGSKRTAIFEHFKDYELRLIVNTRAKSRNSAEFQEIQAKIQGEIKEELFEKCNQLKKSLAAIEIEGSDLSEANSRVQPLLVGEELRRLSMKLETFGSEQSQTSFLGQNLNSVRLLANQFKILYETTSRKAPLSASTYSAILIILIAPPFINFSSLQIALLYFPFLVVTICLSAIMIARTLAKGGQNSVRNSSIWMYLTGMIPGLFNIIGQSIQPNEATKFPIFITVITLPLGYFVFMKVLQVLQPQAIDLVKNDEIVASKELRDVVTKMVGDEFAHTLAHRWAIFIHGKILTRLAATALKLETSKNAGDFDSYRSTLKALTDLLSKPDSEFEEAEINLDLEIASRLDPWLGLVEVDLHIDEDLKKVRSARVHDVGEVVEEIISNSMRHGKSQSVSLRVIRLDEKDIEITAVDDASIAPPIDQTRFGLGTRIFNLASDSRWSITRVDSSTVFKLVMAIE
jgi:hypothetical protein